MELTKREKIFLIICGLLLPVFFNVPQETINKYEIWLHIVFTAPLGFMIATDPKRKAK